MAIQWRSQRWHGTRGCFGLSLEIQLNSYLLVKAVADSIQKLLSTIARELIHSNFDMPQKRPHCTDSSITILRRLKRFAARQPPKAGSQAVGGKEMILENKHPIQARPLLVSSHTTLSQYVWESKTDTVRNASRLQKEDSRQNFLLMHWICQAKKGLHRVWYLRTLLNFWIWCGNSILLFNLILSGPAANINHANLVYYTQVQNRRPGLGSFHCFPNPMPRSTKPLLAEFRFLNDVWYGLFMLQTGLLGQLRAIAATYRVMITDPRQTSCPVQLRGHTLASVGMETRQYPASQGVLHGPGNSGMKRRTG